jgi:hypothetical protein
MCILCDQQWIKERVTMSDAQQDVGLVDSVQFVEALLSNKTREYLAGKGLVKSANPTDKVSPDEYVAIAKAVCSVIGVLDKSVCPLVNNL